MQKNKQKNPFWGGAKKKINLTHTKKNEPNKQNKKPKKRVTQGKYYQSKRELCPSIFQVNTKFYQTKT